VEYVLGIDAGASKTQAVILNIQGQEVTARAERGLSLRHLREQNARKKLHDLCHAVMADATVTSEMFLAAGFGIAGADTPADLREAERLIREAGITVRRVVVENDAVAAFYAATGGEPGLVVVAGTGSIVFGVNESGDRLRVGGLGSILGDEGSGYDLGRRGLIAAIWAEEERGPNTALRTAFLAGLGIDTMLDIHQILRPSEQWTPERIAALAPIVLREAARDDAVALHLATDAGHALGAMTATAARRLHLETPRVVCVGGILLGSDLVFRALSAYVRTAFPGSSVTRSARNPAVGAALMALRSAQGADGAAKWKEGG